MKAYHGSTVASKHRKGTLHSLNISGSHGSALNLIIVLALSLVAGWVGGLLGRRVMKESPDFRHSLYVEAASRAPNECHGKTPYRVLTDETK
jgi:hypothetical protein